MNFTRREMFKRISIAGGALAASAAIESPASMLAGTTRGESCVADLPPAFANLKPLGDRVKPITTGEFQARIAKAQQFMAESKPAFDALFIAAGTSLAYFTGVHWWTSERILAFLLPRDGAPIFISPAFEEGRLRQLLSWQIEIRAWQEDQSPYSLAAQWFAERAIKTGRVGVEETTRYVFFDGLRLAAPSAEYSSADEVIARSREQKSAHELDLLRMACSATFDVYRATFASLREGLSQTDVGELVRRGYEKMGLQGDSLVLFGPSAALPHGTREEKVLREGMGVLIDGGTSVEGYQSDVTRMGVIGQPPAELVTAFEIVRRAQDTALAAAVAGHECGSVDDAARKVIVDAGFGPGYKYFTHRLGHGIGLDGHESPYLVHGSRTVLKPGMTFSNEPGIYVPGKYGVRSEDVMVIGESGAAQLLTPGFARSLGNPVS
jgi:Xaa-Pro dipeptidase